ncbi:MAG: hypothetical protein RDU24_04470 [Humidesulfovibrio sp.]|uniref:hypothetical protein n=1 Tax=Humidesulfovibrio sp. TaxID=2910988 RepID=UPI0027F67484|nr:hypothetical protein [Humidesulfovibrio sp.]MDQ7834615.1 hypothetical protein [Humidesulfovibrio sp.]
MPYDIRLVKLINGESVIGKWSADGKTITDPAVLQTVPSQQGVQMMLLPFGYPFEQEITGEISTAHVLYEYKKAPEELKTKYLEAASSLTLSAPGGGSISSLLK